MEEVGVTVMKVGWYLILFKMKNNKSAPHYIKLTKIHVGDLFLVVYKSPVDDKFGLFNASELIS